jgi:hypothetical protein
MQNPGSDAGVFVCDNDAPRSSFRTRRMAQYCATASLFEHHVDSKSQTSDVIDNKTPLARRKMQGP